MARERADREHFGLGDGISQPGIRGLTAPSDLTSFWDFVTTQAAKQKQSEDLFAAKLVGRYLSGAPLEGADDATRTPAGRIRMSFSKRARSTPSRA
jgi:hypothetical protein